MVVTSNDKTAKALNTYTKLMRAAESVTAGVNRTLSASGLTMSQFGVLEALLHKGPLFQRDLAKKILKSTGNITLVIDNLEKNGLVRRERSAEDRRYFSVNLTEKGKELVSQVFPQVAASIMEDMTSLLDSEQEELGRLCRKLGLKERRQKPE